MRSGYFLGGILIFILFWWTVILGIIGLIMMVYGLVSKSEIEKLAEIEYLARMREMKERDAKSRR